MRLFWSTHEALRLDRIQLDTAWSSEGPILVLTKFTLVSLLQPPVCKTRESPHASFAFNGRVGIPRR
eukprot:1191974-Prorocentrum_minimum.AAC.4